MPVVAGLRGRLVNDYDVEARQLCLVQSKRLPDNPLDSVSRCCRPTMLLGDCQTEARGLVVILPAQHGKPFVPAARRFFEHALVGRSIEQAVVFVKPIWRAADQFSMFVRRRNGRPGAVFSLRRQLGAALGAAPFENEAAGFRSHAGTKAMCACALYFAWLVGAFHWSGACSSNGRFRPSFWEGGKGTQMP